VRTSILTLAFAVTSIGALALTSSGTTGCAAGCDWAAECAGKVGKLDSKRGLLCNYLGSELTLNTTTIYWSTNRDRDPQPWFTCRCDVPNGPGGTMQNCRLSRSDECASLGTCAECEQNFYCGWCNGKCVLDPGSTCGRCM